MFTRIHHVALVVRGLDEALGFYRDVLGLPVGKRATVADQGVHAALLPMRDGEIELLEPADRAGGVSRFLERRGEGLHHLCFETPDIASALTQAKTAGLPLIDQAARPGLAGMIAFLHPKANRGVLVELAQPLTPPTHPEPVPTGIGAVGIGTVHVAVKDLAAAAQTFARNFEARAGRVQDATRLGARGIVVSIGTSRVMLLSSSDTASPVARFLADRGEGLFGVCISVKDFRGALRCLKDAGLSVEVRGMDTPEPLACLESIQVHGVNLFLSQGPPSSAPHLPTA